MNMKSALIVFMVILFGVYPGNGQNRMDKSGKIRKSDLQRDYGIMREIMEACHPGLYLYQTPAKMKEIFDDYYSRIDGDLTELEFYKLIVPMIDSIHCAHTSAELPAEFYDALYSKPLFPLDVEIIDHRLFIERSWINRLGLKPGTEILSINHCPVRQILDSIAPSISADAYQRNYKLYRMALHFRMHYAKYFSRSDEFDLSIAEADGSLHDGILIPGISWNELNRSDTFPTPKPLRYEWIDSLSTCILQIENFSLGYIELFGIDPETFFKQVFREIESKKIRNLVIDVRGNDGGNPEVYIPLIKYLMDKPFHVYAKTVIKTQDFPDLLFKYSDLSRKYKKKWLSSITEDHDGEIIVKPTPSFIATLVHQPDDTVFGGNLYLLTDAGSNSAASDFTSFLKSNRDLKLFGEETGGTASGNTSGIIPTITLPGSGLRINLPLGTGYVNAAGYVKGRGVIPDSTVHRSPEDILQNRDRPLECLLDYIRHSQDILPTP